MTGRVGGTPESWGLGGEVDLWVRSEKIVEQWVDCVCGAVSGSRGVVGER